MKKILSLTAALLLLFSFCAAQAAPEDFVGTALEDFTVTTTDGSEFTLSEALEDHELVLVNL